MCFAEKHNNNKNDWKTLLTSTTQLVLSTLSWENAAGQKGVSTYGKSPETDSRGWDKVTRFWRLQAASQSFIWLCVHIGVADKQTRAPPAEPAVFFRGRLCAPSARLWLFFTRSAPPQCCLRRNNLICFPHRTLSIWTTLRQSLGNFVQGYPRRLRKSHLRGEKTSAPRGVSRHATPLSTALNLRHSRKLFFCEFHSSSRRPSVVPQEGAGNHCN